MPLDELYRLLVSQDWHAAFDARTLGRGLDYAQRKHVHKLELLDDGALRGRVRGSSGQSYACTVALVPTAGRLQVHSQCSCPVDSLCKHAAAMLFDAATSLAIALATRESLSASPRMPTELATRRAAVEMQQWDQWLAAPTASPGSAPPFAAPENRFGLLLRADGPQGQLHALPVWMSPAKNRTGKADWAKPTPLVNSSAGAHPTPAEGWPEDVALALAVLLAAPTHSMVGHHWLVIRSTPAEQALSLLLARYPAWFERGEHPLEAGPTLEATVRWVADDEGNLHPRMQVDASDAVLLQGASLWYVQLPAGRYGRVAGDLPQYRRLQYAPPLRPGQHEGLRQRLAHSPTAAWLPPLPAAEVIEDLRATPQPVLHLQSAHIREWSSGRGIVGVASLRFDYAGHVVPSSEPRGMVTRRGDSGLLAIHRDMTAEAHWIAVLRKAGLTRKDGLYVGFTLGDGRAHEHDWVWQPNKRMLPQSAKEWAPLLPKLAERGFRLQFADDFPHDELVSVDDWHGELTPSGNAWFDVTLGVDIAGERFDLLPILRHLVADPSFPRVPAPREKQHASWRVKLDEKRAVDLPLTRLRALIEPLLEWLEHEGTGTPRVHASQLGELGANTDWHGGDALRRKLEQLRTKAAASKPPRGFKATLRPYQLDGLAWLDFLGAAGLGGILADDMGLGKTVQVLAHLLGGKQRKRLAKPALVVCPTSLVGNWQMEAARFAPTLKVLVLHGAERADRYDELAAHDLAITTYPLLPRDRERLLESAFSLLILDEAQAIKNAASQAAQVVREIPAERRLGMTGTPLENHLGELWAQFDAVEPGLLGSQRQFAKSYRTPIEKHGDRERLERLNRRVKPLLLRRRKDEVLAELPPKTEIVRTLELEGEQRALYETLRLAQHERVRQAVAERGLARSGIIVLDALLKLRQACCDPRLVKLASAKKVKASAKLDALLELVDGLVADGRRVLLFSQFTEMLALIETALAKRKIPHQTLTGQTPARERTAMVERFQQGELPLFLISLKAGGTGLNLTAADTVIHYDPWWNPAAEAQATDRAHRIGQQKPVFVYRLICQGTVEEKIQAMQARKAELAQAILDGGGASQQLRFDEADLEALFGGM